MATRSEPAVIDEAFLAEQRAARDALAYKIRGKVERTDLARFTYKDKLDAIERELRFRYRQFANRVHNGGLDFNYAVDQIATMEAIAADYRGIINSGGNLALGEV